MHRLSVMGIALVLLIAALAGPVPALAAPKTTAEITKRIGNLVDLGKDSALTRKQLGELHKLTRELKVRHGPSWKANKNATALDSDDVVRAWKKGNEAIVRTLSKYASQKTGSMLGYMPTGKNFTDPAFHPWYSDYDYTVFGKKSGDGVKVMEKVAPAGFMDDVKMSIMSSDGNLHRFRGTRFPQSENLPDHLWKSAREKYLTMLERAAPNAGGYISEGAMAGLEEKIAASKYSSKVEFIDSRGVSRGRMDVRKIGSIGEKFGDFRVQHADLLGQAVDNHAQLKNYVAEKGPIEGVRKYIARQNEIIKRLDLNEARRYRAVIDDLARRQEMLEISLKNAENAIKRGGKIKDVNRLISSADEFSRGIVALSAEHSGNVQKSLLRTGADDAVDLTRKSIARLRYERNLIASIVNVGGVDEFKRIVGSDAAGLTGEGRKAMLSMTDEVLAGYDTKRIANLAAMRQAAFEQAAKSAGTSAGKLRKALGVGAEAAGIVAGSLKASGGAMFDLVATPKGAASVDAALTAYYLSQGNYEAAFNAAAEGALTYAVPATMIPFLARDVMGLGMYYLNSRMRGDMEERLSGQAADTFQTWLKDDPQHIRDLANRLRTATDHNDQEFVDDIKALVGTIKWPGSQQRIEGQLRRLIFENRKSFIDHVDFMDKMEEYADAKASNEEWELKRIEKAALEEQRRAKNKPVWVRREELARIRDEDYQQRLKDQRDGEPDIDTSDPVRVWDRRKPDREETGEAGEAPEEEKKITRVWDRPKPDDSKGDEDGTRESDQKPAWERRKKKDKAKQTPDPERKVTSLGVIAPTKKTGDQTGADSDDPSDGGTAVNVPEAWKNLPSTMKIEPWETSDKRSVCYGYHKLVTRHDIHKQFRKLKLLGEAVFDKRYGSCVVRYTGQFRDARGNWMDIDEIELSVDVEQARGRLIKLDPAPEIPSLDPPVDTATRPSSDTPYHPRKICEAWAAKVNTQQVKVWGKLVRIENVRWKPHSSIPEMSYGTCVYTLPDEGGRESEIDGDLAIAQLKTTSAPIWQELRNKHDNWHDNPGDAGQDTCAAVRGTAKPSRLNAAAVTQWLSCNPVGE